MAEAGAADMANAQEASRALFDRIGTFLDDHQLAPSPGNYAFAYDVLLNPAGKAAQAITQICDGRVRLTQAQVDARGPRRRSKASRRWYAR